MSDHDRYVTVRLDSTHIGHFFGKRCKAGEMNPCGISEAVMSRVYDAVRHPPDTSFMCRESRHLKCVGNCDCRCHGAHASDAGLRAALQEIAKGEGAYNRDPLTHASNTIEAMKTLAEAALNAPAAVCDAVAAVKHWRQEHNPRNTEYDTDCLTLWRASEKFPATGGNDA